GHLLLRRARPRTPGPQLVAYQVAVAQRAARGQRLGHHLVADAAGGRGATARRCGTTVAGRGFLRPLDGPAARCTRAWTATGIRMPAATCFGARVPALVRNGAAIGHPAAVAVAGAMVVMRLRLPAGARRLAARRGRRAGERGLVEDLVGLFVQLAVHIGEAPVEHE